MKKTVGQFTLDGSSISGPAQYMTEQGNAFIDKCLKGESVVFNAGLQFSPDPETALLVAVQTDYAGWKGMQPFLGKKVKG